MINFGCTNNDDDFNDFDTAIYFRRFALALKSDMESC